MRWGGTSHDARSELVQPALQGFLILAPQHLQRATIPSPPGQRWMRATPERIFCASVVMLSAQTLDECGKL